MEEFTLELTPQMLLYVPIVAAIVQVIKRMEVMQNNLKLLPIISMVIGVGIAYFTAVPDYTLAGVIIGLAASGGYDLVKSPPVV